MTTAIRLDSISTIEETWRRDRTGDDARRILNVLVAAVGLVLAAPLMVLIGAAIKLTSPGPVIFRQTRIGIDRRWSVAAGGNGRRVVDYGGQPFTLYKFRTMHVPRTNGGGETWATPDDPRLTRLGRVLRRYRLDELPQLINVLRGDMNVVGPRPEQPKIFATLQRRVDRYAERQCVLPGITGWAQINHCYDRCLADVRRKVALDLEYLERRGVVKDLTIMLRTVPVMLGRRGGW